MLWFFLWYRQKPVRLRTWVKWFGPNPWKQEAKEEWSLEVFTRMLHPVLGSSPEAPIVVDAQGAQTNTVFPVPLKRGEYLVLRSNSDGKLYPLPQSMMFFCKREGISLFALPQILADLGNIRTSDTLSLWFHYLLAGLSSIFIALFILVEGWILRGVLTGELRIQEGVPLWGMLAIMLPILLIGVIFLSIGLTRLGRHHRQKKQIFQKIHSPTTEKAG